MKNKISVGEIRYPKFINEMAIFVGSMRTKNNEDKNQGNSYYSRGDQNKSVDILGAKCEMISECYLTSKSIDYDSFPLISDNPIKDADIIIDTSRIDVKGVRTDLNYLAVNEKAHNDTQKNITHYWFIEPTENNVARFWILPKKMVDKWQLRRLRYTNAYCIDKLEIKRILDEKENHVSI